MKKINFVKELICGVVSAILIIQCPVSAATINVPAAVLGGIAAVLGGGCIAGVVSNNKKGAEISRLKTELNSANNRISMLNSDANLKELDLNDGQSRLRETETALASERARIADLSARLNQVSSELEEQSTRVRLFESALSTVYSNCSELETKVKKERCIRNIARGLSNVILDLPEGGEDTEEDAFNASLSLHWMRTFIGRRCTNSLLSAKQDIINAKSMISSNGHDDEIHQKVDESFEVLWCEKVHDILKDKSLTSLYALESMIRNSSD